MCQISILPGKFAQNLSNSHHLTTLFWSSHWMTPLFGEKSLTERPIVSSCCPSTLVTFKVECPWDSYHIVFLVSALHTLPRFSIIQAVEYFIFCHPLIIIRSSLKYDPWHGGRSTEINLDPLIGVIIFSTPTTCSPTAWGNGTKRL